MHPDIERPGALAGATGLDTKSECVACREYSILLPFSPEPHALVFIQRFSVMEERARALSMLVKLDVNGRSLRGYIARRDQAAAWITRANQLPPDLLHIVGDHHAPR
jgi:hypothetical protein